MPKLSLKSGESFIFAEAGLWALFPIVTTFALAGLSPMWALCLSTLFATIFFALIMFWRSKFFELKKQGIWRYVFLMAFFIGWMYYGLYFFALKYTSSGNAAIIATTELCFTYFLFNVWKKEYFSKVHTFGAALILLAAAVIVFPKSGFSFKGGDVLIFLAAAMAPFGNYFQQKLRREISSETMMFLRSILTFPLFFILAFFASGLPAVSPKLWLLLILNGTLILGLSKIFWLEGIHLISVTKAAALGSITPALTLIFAWILLGQNPTLWQIFALIPLIFGVKLLTA